MGNYCYEEYNYHLTIVGQDLMMASNYFVRYQIYNIVATPK